MKKQSKASKSKKPKYELLAPVGDFPMLVSAVNAGADAVYFGLKEFTMELLNNRKSRNIVVVMM